MKNCRQVAKYFISGMIVLLTGLGTSVQAQQSSGQDVSGSTSISMSQIQPVIQQLRLLGIDAQIESVDTAMARWRAVLIDLGMPTITQDTRLTAPSLRTSLFNIDGLVDFIADHAARIETQHQQNKLRQDTQRVLKHLTFVALQHYGFTSSNPRDVDIYFSRRVNTTQDGQQYKNVRLYKPLRELITFWQHTPLGHGSVFSRQNPSVQDVREMLAKGTLDDLTIATFSIQKIDMVHNDRELQASLQK